MKAAKPRPASEVIMRLIQPLADRGVARLARLGVQPPQVVVGHALVGLLAAAFLSSGSWFAWLLAALLLQVKTLLDNMDGVSRA